MIASEKRKRSISSWLQAGVLLCAMVMLPLSVTYAQDYRAVERRLGQAVAEGELSLHHAAEMMEALREVAEDDHDDEVEHRFGVWIGSVGKRLKAAVKAGKLSDEDAWKKWYQFKENELAPSLKASVNAGEMSEEAVWEIWHELEKAEEGERIKAAVAKGEMSKREAWAKWKHFNKESDHNSNRITREDYERKEAELRKLVEKGKISDEDARARLGAMHRMMGHRGERHDHGSPWEGIKERIEGAVKSGNMTREEADAKYKEIGMDSQQHPHGDEALPAGD